MFKRFYILFSGILTAFLPVSAQDMPVGDPLAKPVYEALAKGKFAFTPEVKAAWLAYGEATVRAKQKSINEKTWAWLKARPAILSAAFSADFPIEPNILVNFQRLALPFDPLKADRYSQLILAYAIRYRDSRVAIDRLDEDWDPQALIKGVAKDGDFYLAEQMNIPLPKLSEDHRQLADYLNGPQQLIRKTRKLEITDLMNIPLHEINILTELKVKTIPNWNDIALAGKMYPPYFEYNPTHQQSLAMKIYRFEHHPARPKPPFPIDKADWPMMLALGDLDPLDETSFLWNYYVENKCTRAPLGLGAIPNVLPGEPAFQFRRSKWNPKKFIRIYNGNPKDQGGKGNAFGCRAINLPSEAVAAPPGGIFEIHGEPGNYSVKWSCAIGDDESTSPFYLDRIETIEQTRPARGAIFHYHFKGLALTLTQGREEYEDTRIALALLQLFPTLAREEKIALLESMFLRNPLNSDLVYNLAWLYKAKSDFDAATRMIAAIRGYYDNVQGDAVTGAARAKGQAEVKRIMRDRFANSKNAPFLNNEWVHRICHDVLMHCFDDIPSDVDSIQRNRDALAAELAYQKKTGNKKRIAALTELTGYYNQDLARGRKALQAAKERRAKEGSTP